MAELFDTHQHIHFPDYGLDPEEAIQNASSAGVSRLLSVGCTLEDSKLAIALAAKHPNVWASIGLHPHEGSVYVNDDHALQEFQALAKKPKIVAIGECGLDFYYNHSSREDQFKLLRFQLTVAQEFKLPLIFHVRDAFNEFWPIFDEFHAEKPLSGVIHSFTANSEVLEQILSRGLYVGLNGIMTFTKNHDQLAAAKQVPLDRILVETDAPYLTPTPYRGTMCQPKHVAVTAEFLSNLRGESLEAFATATTNNAMRLFKIDVPI